MLARLVARGYPPLICGGVAARRERVVSAALILIGAPLIPSTRRLVVIRPRLILSIRRLVALALRLFITTSARITLLCTPIAKLGSPITDIRPLVALPHRASAGAIR